MYRFLLAVALVLAALAPAQSAAAGQEAMPHLRSGATVYIEPMSGFEVALEAGILKKKVPLIIVQDKAKADYLLGGASSLERASWAKTIFVSPNSHADANVKLIDQKTGALLFAYSVDKITSWHGDQSTAEACAKHLKQAIEKAEKSGF